MITAADRYHITAQHLADSIRRSFGWATRYRAVNPVNGKPVYEGMIALEGTFMARDFDRLIGTAGTV